MSDSNVDFQRQAVKPMTCLRDGWQLIRERYWLFMGITLVGVLIAGAAPFGILAGPMFCGIYICLFAQQRGQRVKFEMLFKGFEHFVQSLIAALIMMVPILLVLIPGYIVVFITMFATMPKNQPNAPPDPSAGTTFLVTMLIFMAVVFVVMVVVSILFFFTYPLIVDRKLSGVDAVKTSCKAAMGNFGGVLGLVLLVQLLSMLGVLACYVGVFFVMPFHFAAYAVAYRQVFPDLSESPRDLESDGNSKESSTP